MRQYIIISMLLALRLDAAAQVPVPVGVRALSGYQSDSTAAVARAEHASRRSVPPECSADCNRFSASAIGVSARPRHAIYGALIGAAAGAVGGIIASNTCKGGLCQDDRIPVTATVAGIGAIVGALIGWFVATSDP